MSVLGERIYYSFSEIMGNYQISRTDLDNCFMQGDLRVHAWLPPTSVHVLTEIIIENRILYSRIERHWEGYAALFPNDYRQIMRRGFVYLREFQGDDDSEIMQLKSGASGILVQYKDLVILKTQQELIGKKLNRTCSNENKKCAMDVTFRHITFQGIEFRFGEIQASIVKQLYEAAKTGTPWQSGKRLLQVAGSESFNLANIFVRQPSWRSLIISDRKGQYRLHENFPMDL